MEAKQLEIQDVILLSPQKKFDDRGFFSETYNKKQLAALGIKSDFVQDNHSMSLQPFVIRGLHFQKPPHAQAKLVRVIRGSILDVAVDIRHKSPTFGQHVSVVLSADNWRQLWIPEGFAHGFCTLEKNTQVVYKVTDYYSPEYESGIAHDDPELAINWKVPAGTQAILSDKDKALKPLSKKPEIFTYRPGS